MERRNCITCTREFCCFATANPEQKYCFECDPGQANNKFVSQGVSWNCSGGTRGFGGGGKIPKTPGINPGHTPPTLGSLGLSAAQGASIGIE